jgi:hypothetical protein
MTRRRPAAVLALACCAAIAAFATFATHSSASEAEGFTIDDTHMRQSKEFPPIVVFNPSAQVADPTLSDCKSLPSDVAVRITYDIKRPTPTKSHFEVGWGGGGDIDIWFFDNDGELIGDAATASNPEVFNMGGLPNGDYWLCVRNFGGANTGFTVTVEASFLSLFQRPDETPVPTPPPLETPIPVTSAAPGDTSTPVPAEDVETPGPDGETTERDLVAVSGSRQAQPADDGRSGLNIGFLALTGVVVATGVGLVAVRIRRDTKLR